MSRVIYFGNPILRKKSKKLTQTEIKLPETLELINTLEKLVATEEYGVGLAAPQIGVSKSVSVISIKPTPTRPKLNPEKKIIINATYKGIGYRAQMWEGCISSGKGDNTLYAKVPRYKKINATWIDQNGTKQKEILDGFLAHVFQHEVDHLEGVLFVDKVKDTSTYMLASEYRKQFVKKNNK